MKNSMFILAVFFAASLFAQDFDRRKMDSLFAVIDQGDKGMGSVSLFRDGEEVYHHTIGFIDLESGLKAGPRTKYRIGSISKTFTAAIIMQLVDEGKLKLDTPLEKFYPEVPNAKQINIEQMLRHRSGLFNFTSADDYTEWMTEPKTQHELIEIIRKNGTVFEPDERAEYSNTNYVLLSMIVEKVENKKFAEVLEARIIKPCELKNTYYGKIIDPNDDEAFSYEKAGEWKKSTETHMDVPLGAGGIVSTPEDLNKFLNCLFTGTLVSEQSQREMKKIVDGYGIGLFEFPFFERKAIGHTGGIDGFQSVAAWFPEENVSVAYTTNAVDMPRNDILIGVLSIYFGREYDLPEFKPALKLSADVLEQYTGTYSAPDFPLKITFTLDGNVLMAQGTGQPSFALEAFEPDKF
ncbi:MAG: serine hydrolase domain-containing protein, partial [Bacteroidales bacterium]